MKSIQLIQISEEDLVKKITHSILNEFEVRYGNHYNEVNDSKPLLTRKETAELFGISYVCLHEWMNKGLLQVYKIGGKSLFKKKEIIDLINNSKVG